MPEALRAFLKEEARPRQLGGDTPHESQRRRRMPRVTVKEGRRHFSPIGARLSKALLVCLVATALLGAAYWNVMRPEPPGPAPAPRCHAFCRRNYRHPERAAARRAMARRGRALGWQIAGGAGHRRGPRGRLGV